MKEKSKMIKSSSKKLAVPSRSKKALGYEKDFYQWTQIQASLLKKKQFDKIDLEHIIEEIETLGKSDKRKLYSLLVILLQHLLKNTYTIENKGNSKSWGTTIFNSRRGIQHLLEDSPSLKLVLNDIFNDAYHEAREWALIETNHIYKEEVFPLNCPWNLEEIFVD